MKRYRQFRRLQPDAGLIGRRAATRRLAHAPQGSLTIREGIDVLISLRYATGRIHEATYSSSDTLRPGAEFDLYGRRWRVVGPTKTGRGGGDTPPHVVRIHRSQLAPAATVGLEALGGSL
jgi:hypothetical protein